MTGPWADRAFLRGTRYKTDVLTAHTSAERLAAVVEAGLVEVPLALVCLWLARTARRRLQPTIQAGSAVRPRRRAVVLGSPARKGSRKEFANS